MSPVRRLGVLARILAPPLALFAVAGCGGGDGDPTPTSEPEASPTSATEARAAFEQCAGGFAGAFIGEDQGSLEATLTDAGVWEVRLLRRFGRSDIVAVGAVSAEGDGEAVAATGAVVRGRFDLSQCLAAGTWRVGDLSGSWQLARQVDGSTPGDTEAPSVATPTQ